MSVVLFCLPQSPGINLSSGKWAAYKMIKFFQWRRFQGQLQRKHLISITSQGMNSSPLHTKSTLWALTCAVRSSLPASLSCGYNSSQEKKMGYVLDIKKVQYLVKELFFILQEKTEFWLFFTFCLPWASVSVLSFQVLFRSFIGRLPTYLPGKSQRANINGLFRDESTR